MIVVAIVSLLMNLRATNSSGRLGVWFPIFIRQPACQKFERLRRLELCTAKRKKMLETKQRNRGIVNEELAMTYRGPCVRCLELSENRNHSHSA